MTGSGFSTSLGDAAALANALGQVEPGEIVDALVRYEHARLADGRRTVQAGQGFSPLFARSA